MRRCIDGLEKLWRTGVFALLILLALALAMPRVMRRVFPRSTAYADIWLDSATIETEEDGRAHIEIHGYDLLHTNELWLNDKTCIPVVRVRTDTQEAWIPAELAATAKTVRLRRTYWPLDKVDSNTIEITRK